VIEGEWIDVSVPLRAGMVQWPGDPPVVIERTRSLGKGDECNLTRLSLSAHAGTHIDAPAHFLSGGTGIETMPPAAMVGPARVIEIRDPEAIQPAELARHALRRGERVLFKTRNSERARGSGSFLSDFVYVTAEAARVLAEAGVLLVGIDYLSVGGYEKDGDDAHRALLSAGIWILEGLDLSRVSAGDVDLICLPLLVPGADGAPARALVRPRRTA
jgi:arylformamidase